MLSKYKGDRDNERRLTELNRHDLARLPYLINRHIPTKGIGRGNRRSRFYPRIFILWQWLISTVGDDHIIHRFLARIAHVLIHSTHAPGREPLMGHTATMVEGGHRVVVLKLGQTITHLWS